MLQVNNPRLKLYSEKLNEFEFKITLYTDGPIELHRADVSNLILTLQTWLEDTRFKEPVTFKHYLDDCFHWFMLCNSIVVDIRTNKVTSTATLTPLLRVNFENMVTREKLLELEGMNFIRNISNDPFRIQYMLTYPGEVFLGKLKNNQIILED